MFTTMEALARAVGDLPEADAQSRHAALCRQDSLTKPRGSLGRLEDLSVWFAGWRAEQPLAPSILVFAGNHGIAARGVSAFPPAVTSQMVANFRRGGAAVNQLARTAGADLVIVPLWLDEPTADFTTDDAMSTARFLEAVRIGYEAVPRDCDLLAVGEMGIGNTTVASALCAALLGGDPDAWIGPGTGVDDAGIRRKIAVVSAGLSRHAGLLLDPLATAAALGGHELAGILGAVLAARHRSIPVLLDGFVATSAVLPLAVANPRALDHCQSAHLSPEPGHRRLLDRLGMVPMLDLGMRLGEASGAALAIPILLGATACHFAMATFEEAEVSGIAGAESPADATSPIRAGPAPP